MWFPFATPKVKVFDSGKQNSGANLHQKKVQILDFNCGLCDDQVVETWFHVAKRRAQLGRWKAWWGSAFAQSTKWRFSWLDLIYQRISERRSLCCSIQFVKLRAASFGSFVYVHFLILSWLIHDPC